MNDLDVMDVNLWEFETASAETIARSSHSDTLHQLYKTTRKITCDERFLPNWKNFGTFRWQDTRTYSVNGMDIEPGLSINDRKAWNFDTDNRGREGVVFSTGFLEPEYSAENREFGAVGGCYGPNFPIVREKPAVSDDPSELTGISPTDGRPKWGKNSDEYNYWAINGEERRSGYPRIKTIEKGNLTPSQRQVAMEMFHSGHYGSGNYNIDDPSKGRKDIRWKDVKENDLIAVPTPDTNYLAMGGLPIKTINSDRLIIDTKDTLWNDDTTYFSTFEQGTGKAPKPRMTVGDIVQLSGVRGMQEVNGRIFRIIGLVDHGLYFTVELGTWTGDVWSGPGPISWKPDGDNLGFFEMETLPVKMDNFSEYLGGGVLLIHPHPMLLHKADSRERQINIGSPNAESGLNGMHWNQQTSDYNTLWGKPYNNVIESESGHVREVDDTPGAERINEYHRAGTYYEIDHNGTKTDYVKGDRYDITLHDDYVYVKGKVVHTYDDEVMIRCNDRMDLSSKWNLQLWSGGDLDIYSKRNINMKSEGDINFQADGHINFLGTGVTPCQTDEFRAGTRNAEELSKIKMKAGHFIVETVGNEKFPDEPGIALQSNQSKITIKTLRGEGNATKDPGDIVISSANNLELFAWLDQHRTAHTGSLKDLSSMTYFLTTELGSVDILSLSDEIHLTANTDIHLGSCDGKLITVPIETPEINASIVNALVPNCICTGGVCICGAPSSYRDPIWAVSTDRAFIIDTLELQTIDLPSPRPAMSMKDEGIKSLALNENNIAEGFGGENIRNLQDVITDMQDGISAYPTKRFPATDDARTYEENAFSYEMSEYGYLSNYTESYPWNGSEFKPSTMKPLGSEQNRILTINSFCASPAGVTINDEEVFM